MHIVLIAGLWMPTSVWDGTAAELDARGLTATAVRLPGVDDGSTTASLDNQIAAVLAVVDSTERPLVVGHSAAAALAWAVADLRPDSIAGVVLIGGFPVASGETYAAFFELEDGVMPFPGWAPFEGADAADLDDATRAHLADIAVPVPGAVANGRVVYSDERRFSVPVTVVCPEFGPDDLRSWIDSGDVAELGRVEHLDLVDIDSGHWPMVTRPVDLAQLLDVAADTASSLAAGDPSPST